MCPSEHHETKQVLAATTSMSLGNKGMIPICKSMDMSSAVLFSDATLIEKAQAELKERNG